MVSELSHPKEARSGKGLRKAEASEGTQHREKKAQISMTDLDVLSSRLKKDDTCLASSTSAGIWYIDSGASTHMTGVREHFSSYSEAGTSVRITNVLHVLGLGMNLISVSQLQDKGYDIHFTGKKVYVKHPSWKHTRQIGIRSNKLYKL